MLENKKKTSEEVFTHQRAIGIADDLNAAISEIAGLNEAYYIGASYFLNLKNYEGCQDVRFKNLWEYHLKGILTEYLRGNPNGKLEDLKAAYDREE